MKIFAHAHTYTCRLGNTHTKTRMQVYDAITHISEHSVTQAHSKVKYIPKQKQFAVPLMAIVSFTHRPKNSSLSGQSSDSLRLVTSGLC